MIEAILSGENEPVERYLRRLMSLNEEEFWSEVMLLPIGVLLEAYFSIAPRPFDTEVESSVDDELVKLFFLLTMRIFGGISYSDDVKDFLRSSDVLSGVNLLGFVCVYQHKNAGEWITALIKFKPELMAELKEQLEQFGTFLYSRQKRFGKGKSNNADGSDDTCSVMLDAACGFAGLMHAYPPFALAFIDDLDTLELVVSSYTELIPLITQGETRQERMKLSLVTLLNAALEEAYYRPLSLIPNPFPALMSSQEKQDLSSKMCQTVLKLVEFDKTPQNTRCTTLKDAPILADLNSIHYVCARIEDLKRAKNGLDNSFYDFCIQSLKQKLPVISIASSSPFASAETVVATGNDEQVLEYVGKSSLISQVKDIFPDLGDGFVEACLQHYKNNVETVIALILENNLPPELDNLDRQLP